MCIYFQASNTFTRMTNGKGFAVIGCPKCRRIIAADLAFETKICQCGYKINLHTVKHLVECSSGEDAATAVRELQKNSNTGFTSAKDILTTKHSGISKNNL